MSRHAKAPLLLALLLAGCATDRSAAMRGARHCRPAAAPTLIGRMAPTDAAILRRTGAATARRAARGDILTTEYRADRVTVIIDAAGRVTGATCG